MNGILRCFAAPEPVALRPHAGAAPGRSALAVLTVAVLLLLAGRAHAWPSAIGSQFGEQTKAVATDKVGNTYVAGTFESVLVANGHTVTSNGQRDVFVAKLDALGGVLWIASAGSDLDDEVGGIGVDPGGNVYLAGTFYKTMFFTADEKVADPLDLQLTAPTSEFGVSGITCPAHIDATDGFVAKLDKDGKWLWAARAGGKGFDAANDLAVAANGVYVTGSYGNMLQLFNTGSATSAVPDLPIPTDRPDELGGWDGAACEVDIGCEDPVLFPGDVPRIRSSFRAECQRRSDMFVARIDFNGRWTWAVRGGAAVSARSGDAIAVDAGRNIYVSGLRTPATAGLCTGLAGGTCAIDSDCRSGERCDVPDTSYLARVVDNGTTGAVRHAVADLKFAASDVATDGFQNVVVGGTAEQTVTVGAISFPYGSHLSPAPIIVRFADTGLAFAGQWVSGGALNGVDFSCSSCEFGGDAAGNGVAFDEDGNSYFAGEFGPATVADASDFDAPFGPTAAVNNGGHVGGWTVGNGGVGAITVRGHTGITGVASGRGRSILFTGSFFTGTQIIRRTMPMRSTNRYNLRFALAAQPPRTDIPVRVDPQSLRMKWSGVAFDVANACHTVRPSQRIAFQGPPDPTIRFNPAGLASLVAAWEEIECQVAGTDFPAGTELQFEGTSNLAIDDIRLIALDNDLFPEGIVYFLKGSVISASSLSAFSLASETEIFVASLNPDGEWRWAKRAGGEGTEAALAIAAAGDGELVAVGDFTDAAAFENPPPNESGALTAAGGTDGFVARITDAGQWVAEQKWVVGQEVPRPAGAVAKQPVIKLAGAGDPNAFFLWSEFDKKLYAIGPATASVSWFETLQQLEPRKMTTGTADFPGNGGRSGRTQTHVSGAPVDLELNAAVQHCGADAAGDHPLYACRDERGNPTTECGTSPVCAPLGSEYRYTLIVREGDKPSFTNNGARIRIDNQKKVYDATSEGHSVLVYVNDPSADPSKGTVRIDAVRTVLPRGHCQGSGPSQGRSCRVDADCGESAPCGMATDASCTIGAPLADPTHRDPTRRNGWVVNPASRYDGAGADRAHVRETRAGPIIPVNEDSPADSSDDMVVAWYHQNERGIAWPDVATRYACAWPANPDKIVIASGLGSDQGRCGGDSLNLGQSCRSDGDCTQPIPICLPCPPGTVCGPPQGACLGSNRPCSAGERCVPRCDVQPALDPAVFPRARVYDQPNREDAAGVKVPGFNPNEEHAKLFPSRTGLSSPAVFALRNDLGDPKGSDVNELSEPYVLLKYLDPQSSEWRMRVYEVVAEQGPFTFQYDVAAGQQIQPPYPLNILPPCADSCAPDVLDCGDTPLLASCQTTMEGHCAGGGAREGVRCDTDAECPGLASSCAIKAQDRCSGGPRHGEMCGNDAACAAGPTCRRAVGAAAGACAGGSLDGAACTADADCQSACASLCDPAGTSGNLALFKDYRGLGGDGTWTGWWARSKGTVKTQFFYPLQPEFYAKGFDLDHDGAPDDASGTCVPWLDRYARDVKKAPDDPNGFAPPVTVAFESDWPQDLPQLEVGETLLRPATCDGETCLPNIADQAAAEVIFEQHDTGPIQNDRGDLVRLFNPLAERAVFLRQVPADLATDRDGARTLITGNLAGTKIPFALRTRLSFEPGPLSLCDGGVGDALGCSAADTTACAGDAARGIAKGTCKVGGRLRFRGVSDDRNLGEPLLLPNILTDGEWESLRKLSEDSDFGTAVDKLYRKTRNPNGVNRPGTPACHLHLDDMAPCPLEVGFVPDEGSGAKPENVLETKALSAGDPRSEGLVTVIFNNDRQLSPEPVTAKVIRVGCGPYQGQVQVIQSDNVFDEQLTLRHNGDFGGDPGRLKFEWWYALKGKDCKSITTFPGDPGSPWESLGGGNGVVDWTLEGPQLESLADTCIYTRYTGYHGVCENNPVSEWAGAPLPNSGTSSHPGPISQLAPGWLSRVARALNPFDARTKDFRQSAVNTFASMIAQAGKRYEGDIAFNGNADNLNRLGLIETYETVLRRGLDLSIDRGLNVDAVNGKLLDMTSRVASLYMLLGNEAFSDAQDPTIGFSTSSELGSLAPAIFAFQDQLDSPLSEELALLRGRDDGGGPAPIYNRLIWNFTGGTGQVAYQQNYNVHDQDQDGFINEFDAKLLFPQGHGDAWGHYLSALTAYYRLLRNTGLDPDSPADDFRWIPRSDSVLVAGSETLVDFADERKFADAAAARARSGAQIVDLTYRQRWVDDPAGQWQGYKDTDPNRAFGVAEWAARAGQGAYFDWVVANAILPSASDKPPGIEKIDRTTVPELNEIVSQFHAVQAKLDQADAGLNPVGLAKNVVPFDIDPTFLDTGSGIQGQTHFEQIFERAGAAFANAVRVFDYASSLTARLRGNQDSVDDQRQNVVEQERDHNNRLIEIFGSPYPEDIGPGKTYPSGYTGPDLWNYDIVERSELTGGEPGQTEGVLTCDAGTYEGFPCTTYADCCESDDCPDPTTENRCQPGGDFTSFELESIVHKTVNCSDADEQDREDVRNSCRLDPASGKFAYDEDGFPETVRGTLAVRLSNAGFGRVKDPSWTRRTSPGALQMARSDLIQAIGQFQRAVAEHRATIYQIECDLSSIRGQNNEAEDEIEVLQTKRDTKMGLGALIGVAKGVQLGAARAQYIIEKAEDALVAGQATITGAGATVIGDPSFAVRAVIKTGATAAATITGYVQDVAELAQTAAEQAKDSEDDKAEVRTARLEQQNALFTQLGAIGQHVTAQTAASSAVATATEAVRQAQAKVDATLADGLRIYDQLIAFRKKTAAKVADLRYNDMAFRIFRNDALQKYKAQFDLASQYVYLAASAYDYETNLLGTEPNAGRRFLTDIVRQRSLGQVVDGEPVIGSHGLADTLGRMRANFNVIKGQLGFNSPETETNRFSLRRELFRVLAPESLCGDGDDACRQDPQNAALLAGSDAKWRRMLADHYVANLWQVPEFRRFARPFAPESAGPQPGIVIPFDSKVIAGLNFFGRPLGPGDSAYDASKFATKVRSLGVWFSNYNGRGLSNTPRVYLIPVGADVLRPVSATDFTPRDFLILDQKIPVPFPIGQTDLTDPAWSPMLDTLGGSATDIRRYDALRAYHDSGFTQDQVTYSSRAVGRSVWNTQWLLVIPGNTLLGDSNEALNRFIYGQRVGGGGRIVDKNGLARDGNGISDIRIFFQTYAYSGN
ncbi:MAG: hypothetical protein ACRERC_18160 [Candidatus Binatia bacterium]